MQQSPVLDLALWCQYNCRKNSNSLLLVINTLKLLNKIFLCVS